jgi:hypothetical protein
MERSDQVVIKALPGNERCCECQTATNPTWCSVSFGVLVCLECSGKHRGLGTHISFVRSLELDHFTVSQIQLLKEGGNELCNRYLKGDDVRSKYDSSTATLYKKWLLAKVDEGGGEAASSQVLVKECYEELILLIQQQQQSSSASSKNTATPRPRMNFANTTPAPSFLQAFSSTRRLIVGMTSDGLGPWTVKSIVAVFFATLLSTAITTTSSSNSFGPSMLITSYIQWLTLGVTGTFLALVFVLVPLKNTIAFSGHRISAFKSAVNDFTERVYINGRAKRNPGYDIFFPPGVSIGDSCDVALLFYPGMLVDFMAYSILLGKLSDAGVLVVLVNTEPTRMIDRHNGYTAQHAQKLMWEIQTLLGIQVKQWAFGGHSLGGCTASWLAMELGASVVSKCVLLASGNGFHLSQIHKQDAIQVLTIDASNDRIVMGNMADGTTTLDDSLRQAAVRAHPTQQQHVVIEGGNHSGFGHYGPQVYPKRDGDRIGITLVQQQEQTLNATIAFLLSSTPSTNQQHPTDETVVGNSKKQD